MYTWTGIYLLAVVQLIQHAIPLDRISALTPKSMTKIVPDCAAKLIPVARLSTKIWETIARQDNTQSQYFPLENFNLTRRGVAGFMRHFQLCQDCAADGVYLLAMQDEQNNDILRMVRTNFSILTEDGNDDDWNDWTGGNETETHEYPVVPEDEVLLQTTKHWMDEGTSNCTPLHLLCDPVTQCFPYLSYLCEKL
jgi:hypothetical protein